MKQAKWFVHPITVFILSTLALAISLFLYIYWYVQVSTGLKSVIDYYRLDARQFFEAQTWVVILILSLLVAVILTGILIIFIYNLKTLQLYRLQHTFINNFTHELKTPVTSLKLYLETFAKHELPREEQLKYIGFMLQDTERLSENINSILNLARIESRVYKGHFTQVDLMETIERFIAGNTHLFGNCKIRVENPSNEATVHPVIVPLFEMLLMNILTNAMKYNLSGKPSVDISLEPGEHALRIRFRDNGVGISKEDRKRIFRKFYRSQSDDLVTTGGSGIGLYLVQQIARLHRGKVIAESEGPGNGSVFTLILPRKTPKGGPKGGADESD
ncbi:MAG: two-component sensor histidine kinase [Syntrophus sp. RIFOXYC2_FULL_54_9]|nr:MAG: two-component sensor histidine kinase [Syntrophus sp. GWC2_56_31]OHE35150.1 MAG: two-component sensor histidine kinase [Syntrophus sp. RIFOXYC2_FULL_54_9]HBB17722.1 sensor histidine kinase [Syntrophus sp. (in: bacteria)]